jgi:intracellular septation protein A
MMNALTYGVALVMYLVVYRTRVRSIVSATEIMLISTLLALELLRGSQRSTLLVGIYAGIVGLVLGQATWALNYMRLQSLTGGLILLLIFYNMVGLSQHAIRGRVGRRIVIEFGLITIAALALIWEFAPRAGG